MSGNDFKESYKTNWNSHATENHTNLTEVISFNLARMKSSLTNQNY